MAFTRVIRMNFFMTQSYLLVIIFRRDILLLAWFVMQMTLVVFE